MHWLTLACVMTLTGIVIFGLPSDRPAAAQEVVPESPFFWDTNGDPNAGWIAAIVDAGYSNGCDTPFDDFFCPREPLLREQAAAWLARALDLPLDEPSVFVDDDNSLFEAEIAALAAAGVVLGCDDSGELFCPTEPATERELGWMLERAFATPPPAGGEDPVSRSTAAAMVGSAAGLAADATLTFTTGLSVDSGRITASGLDAGATYLVVIPDASFDVVADDQGGFSVDLPPTTSPIGATVAVVSDTRVWRAPLPLHDRIDIFQYFPSVDECNSRPFELGHLEIHGSGWYPAAPVEVRIASAGSLDRRQVTADESGRIDADLGQAVTNRLQDAWAFQMGPQGLIMSMEIATAVCGAVETTTTTVAATPTTTPPPATTVPPTTQPPATTKPTTQPPPTTTEATLPTTSGSPSEEALQNIKDQLRPGTVGWNPPTEMEVGVKTQVDVTVALTGTEDGATPDPVPGTDDGDGGESVQLSSFVRVTLEGDAFDVELIGGENTRPLIGETTWIFDVEPVETGDQVLTLNVQPIVDVDGERDTSVAPYIQRVTVTARASQDVGVAGATITQPDSTPTTGSTGPLADGPASDGGGGFPWWLLIIVAAGAAGGAYAVGRQRRRPTGAGAAAPAAAAGPADAGPATAGVTAASAVGAAAAASAIPMPGDGVSRTYKDFDISVSGDDEHGYVVRVDDAPRGSGTSESFTLDPLDVENRINQTLGPRLATVRSPQKKRIVSARELGSLLYDSLFVGEVGTALIRSQDKAEEDETGLRIRLNLDQAPDLVGVPWEFLYRSDVDQFLTTSSWWPIVRLIPGVERADSLEIEPPLRILVMVSRPSDYEDLATADELEWIHAAVAPYAEGRIVQVVEVEPTMDALQAALPGAGFHVFHFIGHGTYDDELNDGKLLMCDEDGRGRFVSGREVGDLLADERTMRLVVLNSCEGAVGDESDRFAGTAEAFVRKGIPAVVAMQFNIPDAAAVAFSKKFYQSITAGFPVDGAVAEARRAVRGDDHDVEWAIPVLYLSAEDGHLFGFPKAT